MRNIGGVLAQRKLTRAIISAIRIAGQSYEWLHCKTNRWARMSDNDADIEIFVKGISWSRGRQGRAVLYNLTVPIVGNNVDLCLFNCGNREFTDRRHAKDIFASAGSYIAIGELKGGIDPAGADEHWKTAQTALARIQESFAKAGHIPQVFFIGAAIEAKMAVEIWSQLKGGTLANAANLTDDNQIASVSRLLCSL